VGGRKQNILQFRPAQPLAIITEPYDANLTEAAFNQFLRGQSALSLVDCPAVGNYFKKMSINSFAQMDVQKISVPHIRFLIVISMLDIHAPYW